MNPITKIALRRLRRDLPKSIFLAIAVFFSSAVISLLVFFKLQTATAVNTPYAALPFNRFLIELSSAMDVAVAALVLLTFVMLKIHCDIKREDDRRTLAVLSAIGATAKQSRRLVATDVLILYIPPIILGALVGIIPGIRIATRFQGLSQTQTGSPEVYALTALCLISAAILLVLLCAFPPRLDSKRSSIIGSIKGVNTKASETRHGYRESQTYKSQTILKRLAKKSTDFHSRVYNRIAIAYASSVLYPMLAAMLFIRIGEADIVLDGNPYDSIDTSRAALAAVDDILLFLLVAFLALTLVGTAQAVLMSRIQRATRKAGSRIYLALGMTRSDINKMIRLELGSVAFKAAVILIFTAAVIVFALGMV